MERIALTLMILWAALILPVAPASADDDALHNLSFKQIAAKASGTEVRWYMYGGWAHVNDWVDTHVAAEMKKQYDIKLVRVPMDAGVFVNKLLNEKAAGKQKGSIDLLWINGENFKNAKEAGLLFGPFADKLPNVKTYVDPASLTHDFGYPVEGYEAPYGRAQFVFEYDSAQVKTAPADLAGLKAWIMANPGRFTYPQPPDFTGSAFIRQVFYAVTGGHEQYMAGWDADLFAKKAPPALAMAQRCGALSMAERANLPERLRHSGYIIFPGGSGLRHVLSALPRPEQDYRRQLSGHRPDFRTEGRCHIQHPFYGHSLQCTQQGRRHGPGKPADLPGSPIVQIPSGQLGRFHGSGYFPSV